MHLQVCVRIYACVAGVSVHGICMFGRECVDMVYALLFGGGSVYMTCAPLIGGSVFTVYECSAEGVCTR